ncbi:hypothetical protein PRUPE_3G159300 [Prunus persica]|uniref:Uncharacterized protein n=1 Tax=Prunus persica TaxID=3760 RepID=A0A251Q0U3_PRUPE|nr:hypothetical protein PRUPE_3G159300 [Prunus persica]
MAENSCDLNSHSQSPSLQGIQWGCKHMLLSRVIYSCTTLKSHEIILKINSKILVLKKINMPLKIQKDNNSFVLTSLIRKPEDKFKNGIICQNHVST